MIILIILLWQPRAVRVRRAAEAASAASQVHHRPTVGQSQVSQETQIHVNRCSHICDYVIHGRPLIELNARPILSAEEFVTAESIVTKFSAAGGVGEQALQVVDKNQASRWRSS